MEGQSTNVFDGDDAGFLAWLAGSPAGFVVNTRRQPDPQYMVLHRASCHHINRYTAGSSSGGFTERAYIKVCAGSIEALQEWVRYNGRSDGTFSNECGSCKPLSGNQRE